MEFVFNGISVYELYYASCEQCLFNCFHILDVISQHVKSAPTVSHCALYHTLCILILPLQVWRYQQMPTYWKRFASKYLKICFFYFVIKLSTTGSIVLRSSSVIIVSDFTFLAKHRALYSDFSDLDVGNISKSHFAI